MTFYPFLQWAYDRDKFMQAMGAVEYAQHLDQLFGQTGSTIYFLMPEDLKTSISLGGYDPNTHRVQLLKPEQIKEIALKGYQAALVISTTREIPKELSDLLGEYNFILV